MSQHDYIISDADGATFLADLNDALAAIATTNSGNTRPSTIQPGQMWIDTNTPSGTVWTLYVYDGTDDIRLGQVDTVNNLFLCEPDAAQTYTNKTLNACTLSGTTNNTGTLSGGTISGPTLTGTITNSATISGGTLSANTLAGSMVLSSVTFNHASSTPGTQILGVLDAAGRGVQFYAGSDGTGLNAANAILKVRQATGTGRSVNASGTVNASGADYAEYETKRDDCGEIQKGQIVGFDSDGRLTDKWALAVTFGVKSTNPNLVGGDVWGTPEALGLELPELAPEPVKPEPPEDVSEEQATAHQAELTAHEKRMKAWKKERVKYESAMTAFMEAHEAARQQVDRIAYCGKASCNVYDCEPGDYVIPVEGDNGTITGVGVKPEELTLQQHLTCIGQVRRILSDGRAEVSVKPF